jgi:hypothetical protein
MLRFRVWVYRHPRVRRAWLLTKLLWAGSFLALVTAPPAAAQGFAVAMAWTGLHDSTGQSPASYFISIVSVADAVRAQGPDFGVDPSTWTPALLSTLQTALTYSQLAGVMGFMCAWFVAISMLGIWFIKFCLSTTWLAWLAALAAPIVATISTLVDQLWVLPIALLACFGVGGVVWIVRGAGAGLGVMGGGVLGVLLIYVLLRDPVGELISDNGILGIGRTLGFTVAQGTANNGPLATGGTAAQLDTLTSWLCDVLIRYPIQIVNFGQVIDTIPGCASLWNQALNAGTLAGPAYAMKGCAPSAFAYAAQIDAFSAGFLAFVTGVVFVILWAIDYVGCEVVRIGFHAFWNLLVIIVAAPVGVAPGPGRRFAIRTALKLVVHGIEMLAATAGLGILVILMSHVARGSLPGAIGMDAPLAKLIVMLLLAVGGAFAFRKLLRAFGDAGIPVPRPVRAVTNVVSTTVRASNTATALGRAASQGKSLAERVLDKRKGASKGSETGSGGPQAPGRRGHPPAPSGPRRPPNGPGGQGSGGPGRRSSGMTPAQAREAARGAGNGGSAAAAAGGKAQAAQAAGRVATATKVGTAVAAPEVAVGVAAAQAVSSRLGGKRSDSRSPKGNAPGRTPSPPSGGALPPLPGQGAQQQARRSPEGGRSPRPAPPPPGRTPPRGKEQ